LLIFAAPFRLPKTGSREILLDRWPWFRSLRVGQRSDYPPCPDSLPQHRRGKLLDRDTLLLPEPYPVVLALVQYFGTLALETPLQNQPLVLSALLEVAKVYGTSCSCYLHLRPDIYEAEELIFVVACRSASPGKSLPAGFVSALVCLAPRRAQD
jgi:hypothetical protein